MKLAVVIPCYNHERYVAAAIESVLNQTRPPDRFLIIDDGSKDDSVEIIRGFAKQGVECVVQENAGAHNTLNRAIETVAEDCDIISILNSDDLYEPTRFEKLLPAFEDESIAVVSSGLTLIDDDGATLPEESPRAKWFRTAWAIGEEESMDLATWLGAANFPATTGNVIARSAYLRENPFRPYRFNHDYFFLSGAVLRGKLSIVPEPLMRYRVHANNTMNVDPAPLLREQLQMNLDLYHHLAPELANDEVRARFYRFTRAAWRNVSALHPGLLQVLLAQLAARSTDAEIEQLVAELDVEELNRYPSATLVNEGADSALLADRLGELKRLQSGIKADNSTLKELTRLRAKLSESRWVALGNLLGATSKLARNEGKSPEEKLTALRNRIESSGWLRFGENLGIWKSS